MKLSMITRIAVLAAFAAAAPAGHAEDIDIFGGVGGSGVPNILIVVDSNASNDAATGSYTCSYAPLSNGKLLDMLQCALYMAVEGITNQPALRDKLRIGLMHVGPKNNKFGEMMYPANAPWDLPLMDAAGIAAFKTFLQPPTDIKSQGGADLGDAVYEAWAFLTGHPGPRNQNYTAHLGGALSCQKTFIIQIGNAQRHGSHNPGGSISDLQNAIPAPTAAQLVQINTSNLGINRDWEQSSIDEWARYLSQTDFNNNANDRQSITTYTIGAYSDDLDLSIAQQLQSAANQGGGKAFLGNNLGALTTALTAIFTEVAAVNSVFASSSLPVSANAQGTYLNQVFVGMFRPDANDSPRWLGNLKQYQFGVGGTVASPTLFLADSTGASAISSAGTGFISPNAVSFWTSKNTSVLPDASPINGFWVNNPQGAGGAYDSPDGEFVEKGGAGQQLRLANRTDDYAATAGSLTNPRNLFTTCVPSCAVNSSLSGSPFATSNANLTAAAFGISGPTSGVSTISRNGALVTMVLTAAPATPLTDGQNVTVTGASNIELNGNFTISQLQPDGKTFKYTIVESPPTPSTGTFTASIPVIPKTITALTRTGTTGSTASATTSAAHGFSTGQQVVITGAAQSEYNPGAVTITVTGTTTFTYPITPGPGSATTGGTAGIGGGNTNQVIFTAAQISLGTINNDATYSRIVTVNAGADLPPQYVAGALVNIAGVSPVVGYNVSLATILFGGGNGAGKSCPNGANKDRAFCYKIDTSPAFPATGAPVADPSAFASIPAGGITHTTSCTGGSPSPNVTVTVVASAALPSTFVTGASVTMSGSPGTRETAYLFGGNPVAITKINSTSFSFTNPITTTPPCSPSASGVSVITTPGNVDKDSLINWVRGYDNVGDELSPGSPINVRPSIHGDVVHSRPAVVNYGGTGIVAFYGTNDGVFRAVNGNKSGASIGSALPGGEIWGFVAPEFFTKLARLYTNSPLVKLASTPTGLVPTPTAKDYFFDGATSVYQDSSKVLLFLSARRGARLVYALDVTSPADPKFLWRKSNSDTNMGELGYTWSTPKAARVRGYAKPVVIFGGGYDPNEDNEPPLLNANTMGRGIFILDATDGSVVWQATYSASGAATCTGTPCLLSGMTYGIPADITLMNRDFDSNGYIDRLYAADSGGNIWRVDLEPAGYAAAANAVGPGTWKVTQFASLGGSGATKRKFLFPPDVIATKYVDMVAAVTGDREHPMYNASATSSYKIINRFYALKDTKTGPDATGFTTITDGTDSLFDDPVTGLTNATSTLYDMTTANNGFFKTLLNAGEKGVNAPAVPPGGSVYFGTSTPPTPSSLACNNLGTARGYKVNVFTGAAASVIFDGGGLPPSPVAGFVTVDVGGVSRLVPYCLGCGDPGGAGSAPDSKSSLGALKPPVPVKPIRKRVYWYIDKHDN